MSLADVEKYPSTSGLELENPSSKSFVRSCTYCYDIATIVLSLLDFITDVLILITYYNLNQMTFFTLSLISLIVAHLIFSILFVFKYAKPDLKFSKKLLFLIVIIPFSPLISIIFYWTSFPNNKLTPIFKKYNLITTEYQPPSELHQLSFGITNLQTILQKTTIHHTGFIVEAIIGSFPQSIIQCIAMIMYWGDNEKNDNSDITTFSEILAMVSILISMISISMKAIVICGSLNFSCFLFNFFCAVTDFFGLYLMIAWVFYSPNDEITLFGEIWIWKVFVCTVCPIMILTAFGMYFV